ncbi:MAG: prolyl oligopeptidase family serine peptidase [Chitinophagaceae bacterium]|nr:prolyl oligopeptidase family serine peptidase [Chitinophagaceae bacterium]
MDHSVYDEWEHVGDKVMSHDGKWLVYTIDPQEGDGRLIIQASDNSFKKTIPRGYSPVITENSRYVIFKIKPLYKDLREARIKKKKPADMPKDTLVIMELGSDSMLKKANLKNFKIPHKQHHYIAYQLDKKPETSKISSAAETGLQKKVDSLLKVTDSLKRSIEQQKLKKRIKDETEDFMKYNDLYEAADADQEDEATLTQEKPSDLFVLHLASGKEMIFSDVLDYEFSKNGESILVEQLVSVSDSIKQKKLTVHHLAENKSLLLSKGGNDYKQFASSYDDTQWVFITETESYPKIQVKFHKLKYYRKGMDSAVTIVDKNTPGMKVGMTVSEHGQVFFSKSGKRIFFGSSPIPVPKDTTIEETETPKLDIWHYNDDYLQTVQTFPARLKAAKEENYLTLYNPETKTLKQLGSRQIPQVTVTGEGDGNIFIGITDFGKRAEGQWLGTTRKDVYAIDVAEGKTRRIKQDLHGTVYPSSTGKYILWYDRKEKHYFLWDGKQIRNLTKNVKAAFYQENWDMPDDPNNYGIVKWDENDTHVLIYDRYGVWKLPVNEDKPAILIAGNREKKIRYRYIQTDPEELFLRKGQTMVFSSFNENTKETGLWKAVYSPDAKGLLEFSELTPVGPYWISGVQKARNTEAFLFTKESFRQSPDLYYVNLNSQIEQKLTSLNPQQDKYFWGTAELFRWKAYNNKEGTGILFRPENVHHSKKYPLLVYIYERLSDNLHQYRQPAPSRSSLNVTYFVSNGYFVFLPDIEYKVGAPAQSAYDYVVSGVRALLKQERIDSTRIGIQGHSWGGYQVVQLATMTNLFKAVWAGAPVVNMTSAYGGIRWESGVSRQFQYEKTQSRLGASLWEKPELYLKNSPLFQLNKVTAPIVVMHNDNDGAVPWSQGIELFTALRRLGKKVWMLNYNGQGHGLTQRKDMKDYQIRMQQFFDYMLKNEKPARWITQGVPAVRKGQDLGLEIDKD